MKSLLSQNFIILPFDQYIKNKQLEKVIILRHDVDAKPEKSLETAILESQLNVSATYYFKTTPSVLDENIIRQIADLGHEIGYHYEDLSASKGEFEIAIKSFEKNLARLRKIVPISTICMDGNAFSPYNNLNLWKNYQYSDFGLSGEPYLDLDFNEFLYLTDTGRGWNAVNYSFYDKVNTRFKYFNKSTFDIMDDLVNNRLPSQKLHINNHPQRWNNEILPWTKEFISQNGKNIIKFLLLKVREPKIRQ
ncbi:MAG: hypothetical protein WCL00_04175 [Bacteroidota bacterium]